VGVWRAGAGEEAMSTILIADDSALMRQVLRAQLESLSTDILEAADGQAALDLARTAHPRVAVLDFDLPRWNGVAVCAQLKADPTTADIGVVILTASIDDDVQGYAFMAGADCLLTKPWRMQALRQRIAALLAN
jgi:two-component system phosphate regulon response regulator PhoB